MKRHNLLSIGINHCSYGEFMEAALALSEARESSYICFANVHMITECHRDPAYRKTINGADLVAPDGQPIAVLLGLARRRRPNRISGPDFFVDLVKTCSEKDKSVYFYGSTPEVLEKLKQRLSFRLPRLQVKGTYSPPFRDLTPDETANVINMINQASADYIFVALGCPKQEKWMAANRGKIKGCMLGVGQAFQIHAGDIKRAPRWMQTAGLEWAFRLCTEPTRLWRRYTFTNAYFLYLILKNGLSPASGTPETEDII